MEKTFKIGNKEFQFNMPIILDPPTVAILQQWTNLIKQEKSEEDIWSVIPGLPDYKFKNISVKFINLEDHTPCEVSLEFTYDKCENIN